MTDVVLRSLGQRIRDLRLSKGWSLKELARRGSLSERFLIEVESGAGNISVRRLASLARALGTSPSALLEEPAREVIALLGVRGAGKTTVGKRLAKRLRVPFLELDQRIEESSGLSLAEIFALHGEGYYRRLERETLEAILAEPGPVVLATGGGLVTSRETYTLLLRRATGVWLKARPEDHWNRVVQQGDRRPMAEHPEAMAELRRLLASRESLYRDAHHIVETSRLKADEVVDRIATLVRPGS